MTIRVVVKVSIDVPAIRVEVVEIVLFVILTVQYGNCGLSVLNIRFPTAVMVFELSLLQYKDIVVLFCIERLLDVRTFVLVDLFREFHSSFLLNYCTWKKFYKFYKRYVK